MVSEEHAAKTSFGEDLGFVTGLKTCRFSSNIDSWQVSVLPFASQQVVQELECNFVSRIHAVDFLSRLSQVDENPYYTQNAPGAPRFFGTQ